MKLVLSTTTLQLHCSCVAILIFEDMLNATWGNDWFIVIYFVLLVAFGAFFVMNLAMAVIWDEYAAADEKRQADAAAEQEAQDVQDAKDESERTKRTLEQIAMDDATAALDKEDSKYCCNHVTVRLMYALVTSGPFDAFITIFILLNTITLALGKYSSEESEHRVMEAL